MRYVSRGAHYIQAVFIIRAHTERYISRLCIRDVFP